MERRAVALDPELADAHVVARRRAAQPRPGRRGYRVGERGDQARARERPGLPGARTRATGPGRATSPPRFPRSARRSSSTRRPAIRTCSSACCSRGKANTRRRKRSAAARSSSRINTSRAMPDYRSWARTRGSATCSICRAATKKRSASTSAGLALWVERSRAQGAHEHRDHDEDRRRLPSDGEGRGSGALLRSRAQSFDARVAKGADDPYTRYYIACLLALGDDEEKALDVLERVYASLPALTAARARRDPGPRQPPRPAQVRGHYQRRDRRESRIASHLVPADRPLVPVQSQTRPNNIR